MKRIAVGGSFLCIFCGIALHCAAAEKDGTNVLYEMDAVVITANRVGSALNDIPADVTVLDQTSIDRPGTKNLLEALREVPGIKVNSRQNNGIFGNGVDIRGLSANATSGGNLLYVLDGVPQRRLSFGGPYYGALPHNAVYRMELVKGALTTQYGRGAMAGALQMFTTPPDPTKLSAELSTMYESETDFFQQVLRGNIPIEELYGGNLSISVGNDHADGWQDNTESDHQDIYFNMGLGVTEKDYISVFGGAYSGNDDVATPLFVDNRGNLEPYMKRDGSLAPNNHNYVDLNEYRLGFSWQRDWSDQFQSKLTSSYWEGDTEWGVNRPWSKPVGYAVGNSMIDNVRYMTVEWEEYGVFNEAMLTWFYESDNDIDGQLSGGVNYEQWNWKNRSWNYGRVRYNPANGFVDNSNVNKNVSPGEVETDALFWGPFLINTLNFGDSFDLQAGIRFDRYENDQEDKVSGKEYSGNQEFFSPSVGGVWHFIKEESTRADFYANWGQNYNPVTRTGVNAGILDADPELSETIEAGLRGSFLDNLIEPVVSVYQVNRMDVPQMVDGTYQSSDDWKIHGLELSLAVHPVDEMTLFSALTLQEPEIDKSDKNPEREGNTIMFASKRLLKFGGKYQHSSGVGGGFQTYHVGSTYADSANSVHIPSYWLTDTWISYSWDHASVSFFINNIFEEKYYCGGFDSSDGMVFAGTPRTLGVSAKMFF